MYVLHAWERQGKMYPPLESCGRDERAFQGSARPPHLNRVHCSLNQYPEYKCMKADHGISKVCNWGWRETDTLMLSVGCIALKGYEYDGLHSYLLFTPSLLPRPVCIVRYLLTLEAKAKTYFVLNAALVSTFYYSTPLRLLSCIFNDVFLESWHFNISTVHRSTPNHHNWVWGLENGTHYPIYPIFRYIIQ